MPNVATAKRERFSRRLRKVLEGIPIVGVALAMIFGFFESQIQELLRRKNSYKLAVFFKYQVFVSFFGAFM